MSKVEQEKALLRQRLREIDQVLAILEFDRRQLKEAIRQLAQSPTPASCAAK